jgi:hypothetical protein
MEKVKGEIDLDHGVLWVKIKSLYFQRAAVEKMDHFGYHCQSIHKD